MRKPFLVMAFHPSEIKNSISVEAKATTTHAALIASDSQPTYNNAIMRTSNKDTSTEKLNSLTLVMLSTPSAIDPSTSTEDDSDSNIALLIIPVTQPTKITSVVPASTKDTSTMKSKDTAEVMTSVSSATDSSISAEGISPTTLLS